MEGLQLPNTVKGKGSLSLGLAGPAMIHLQHQQDAERLGVAQVERVRENLPLLRDYLNTHRENHDLEDWLGAWDVAEEQSKTRKTFLEQSLQSVAQILDSYLDTAIAWKATTNQLPN
jgi:hypothetical protein